eukprot:GHVP01021792.1.p1 GENE.GHVP01021792.1~~GHVP01021792.1.p1  ORF type:complete len:299 (+),score=39.93 GHVP01021792.1:51-947(+)
MKEVLHACQDGFVFAWRSESGYKVGQYNCQKKACVANFDITYLTEMMVLGTTTGDISIIDLETSKMKFEKVQDGVQKLNYLEWCTDIKQTEYAVANNDTVSIYSHHNIKPNMVFQCSGEVSQVRWGMCDQTLIALLKSGEIQVHDIRSEAKNESQIYQEHKGHILSSDFTFDRKLLLTGSYDGTAKLWDPSNFEVIQTYEVGRPVRATSINPLWEDADSNSRSVLLAGGQDAKDVTTTGMSEGKFEVFMFDMSRETEIARLTNLHHSPVTALAHLRNGMGHLSGGGNDGMLFLCHYNW